MKKVIMLSAALLLLLTSCSEKEYTKDEQAARELAGRVLGKKAKSFEFIQTSDTLDTYTIKSKGGKIVVSGNNANSMAVGLNHYLKYYCHVEYGWLLNDTFTLPGRLPKIETPFTSTAKVKDRFFLNYCTFGYTMPWWQWRDWEHFIDWMALNGVNLPLAITGQESVWYQIWTEMGLTDEEVRGYFTGPSHLPWHRMQNIDRWGGPLPQSWLDGQLELQKRICERERQLNMKPVLPAFAGHVPAELSRIFPDAPMTKLEAWSGYPDYYACTFLDPMSDLYTDIQKRFVEKERELYGTDHIYGIDIFNELMPPSWEPEYLGRVSRQVYESLEKADPEATWLQMGWLFYNERKYWLNDRVEAYLTSFPTERQLLLDYFCERQEVWQRTEKFFGVPYIWCYLGNFGGNTALVGPVKLIAERLDNTFVNGGENFRGIGATLEGFDCNPYIYEFLMEKAWDAPQTQDIESWIEALADQRVGKVSDEARQAWKIILDSVYVDTSTPGQSSYINQRPNIGRAKTYYSNARLKYEPEILERALGMLLEVDGKGTAYSFDLTNLCRQMLANRFDTLKKKYDAAYQERDREAMKEISSTMLGIYDDMERVLATQTYFLMGKWIDDARSWGADDAEKDYFESNARNLLTTWSDKAQTLNDYACRTWNGLAGSFYKTRYEKFFAAVEATLDAGQEWDDETYAPYHEDVTTFEKAWWTDHIGSFPATPQGDSKTVVKEVYAKYCR